MAQFDVYVNPVPNTRSAYPYVVVLQSNVAQTSQDQIVAPLARQQALPTLTRRVTPVVKIDHEDYVVVVPKMTGVPARSLAQQRCSIAAARSELLAAVDYLFFGV